MDNRKKYANKIKDFAADILSYAMYMEDKECTTDDEVSGMMLDIIGPELRFYQLIADCEWFSPAAKKYLAKAREMTGVDVSLLKNWENE